MATWPSLALLSIGNWLTTHGMEATGSGETQWCDFNITSDLENKARHYVPRAATADDAIADDATVTSRQKVLYSATDSQGNKVDQHLCKSSENEITTKKKEKKS
jgi:hypothetical protein